MSKSAGKTMRRLLFVLAALLAAFAIGVCGVSSADAARHKRVRGKHVPVAAVPPYRVEAAVPRFPVYAVPMNRPLWAPLQQCFTEEARGRFLPCDLGNGGGN